MTMAVDHPRLAAVTSKYRLELVATVKLPAAVTVVVLRQLPELRAACGALRRWLVGELCRSEARGAPTAQAGRHACMRFALYAFRSRLLYDQFPPLLFLARSKHRQALDIH